MKRSVVFLAMLLFSIPVLAAPGSTDEVWKAEEVFRSGGMALDLAVGDLDQDGVRDVMLLFPDRLELWFGESDGFRFRYAFTLPDGDNPAAALRIVAGDLLFCSASNGNGKPVLALATNRLPQGLRLRWNGRDLAAIGVVGGVPLACGENGFWFSRYESTGAQLVPELKHGSQTQNLPSPMLSLRKTGQGNWMAVQSDGTLFDLAANKPLTLECGAHPALVSSKDGEVLVCSNARIAPDADGIRVFWLGKDGPEPDGASVETPGWVQALAAAEEGKRWVVFAARFLPATKQTLVERYMK